MSTLSVDKVEPVGSTLTFGQSGDTMTIPAGATFTNNGNATGFAAGSTHASQWRITAGFSGSYNPIISNWACVVADDPATNTVSPSSTTALGAPMSVDGSTGFWTFPVTGWWTVAFVTWFLPMGNGNQETGGYINYAGDGSTFVKMSDGNGPHEASYRFGSYSELLVKVSDVTQEKVSFAFTSPTAASVYGSPSKNQTYATFIRIGELA